MDAFEQQVLRTAMAEGMAARRRALIVVTWVVAFGSLAVHLLALYTRDLDTTTRIALGLVVALNFGVAIALPAISARWFYQLVFWWIVILCTTMVLQMVNFHFGTAREFMLDGGPPMLLVMMPLVVCGIFTFLSYSTATIVSTVFTLLLAVVFLGNQMVNGEEIRSQYGTAMSAITIFTVLPATILLMRLFYRLHASAAAAVQDSFHKAREQAATASHERLHDKLTGVLNGTGVYEKLAAALGAARQTAVVRIKLNEAENFRTAMGDRAFDNILRHIAVDLREGLGGRTQIGRLEGCEFVLWTDEVIDLDELGEKAEALRTRLRDGMSRRDPSATVMAGFGVFPQHSAVEFVMEEIGFRLYMDSVADEDISQPQGL